MCFFRDKTFATNIFTCCNYISTLYVRSFQRVRDLFYSMFNCTVLCSGTQVGSIEGRNDLEAGRRTTDKVTAKKLTGGV